MKDESTITTSLLNEVRVKLHIKSNTDTQVKNLWMCLNYDQKPSVSHIVEHIRKNLCTSFSSADLKSRGVEPEVKLYLDEFWLPNYESSRLIRENDCVKVELNYDEKSSKQDWYQNKNKCQQQVALKKTDQQWADHQQHTSEHENNNNYYHYFENENENETSKTRQRDFNPFDFWTSNHNQRQSNETEAYESQTKANQKPTVATCKPKPAKQTHSPKQQAVKSTAQSLAKQQTKVNTQQCYKKFAVGSYAHLLNEPVEEQYETVKKTTSQVKKAKEHEIHEDEIRADYYHDQSLKNHETEIDFNRIASNVNSTGRQKWKNSSKSTQSNGPKHIIFPTSSEESSESSSSESESEAPVQRKTTTAAATVSNQKKNYYEPTKEEQLNAVNTNRSYTIQNPKNLTEFKKVFNEKKLNAPKAEELNKQAKQKQQQVVLKQVDSSSSDSSSSSSSGSSSPSKKELKSPSSPKVDYEKLAKLEGIPRLDDKLAFQILEISSNFTPEISAFKTGTVVDVDNATNEITIRLNNKYNAVLKKPSKFSVVLDETEEEQGLANEDEEPVKIKQNQDNFLKVDWRNLMNLKLLPEEISSKSEVFPIVEKHQETQLSSVAI